MPRAAGMGLLQYLCCVVLRLAQLLLRLAKGTMLQPISDFKDFKAYPTHANDMNLYDVFRVVLVIIL
jgi:hypothetical protein